MQEPTYMQEQNPANGAFGDAIEILEPQPLAQLGGEVDVQIATAKRYPRSIKAFKEQAMMMATFDEATAAGCFYSLPRGGKPIEGPSARLAEIVLSAWGNVRADARVVAIEDKEVIAEAMTWDLEKNVAIRVQVRRRITGKNGQRFNDDMITVTGNAACAIALRNSVFKVIPNVFTNSIYHAARKAAIGDIKTIAASRADMVEYFGKMGVTADRVFAAVGKANIEEIGLDELATLKGVATAIKDNEFTVDEAFPPLSSGNGSAGVEGLKDRINKNKTEATAETAPAADTASATEPATAPEPTSTEAEAPAVETAPVAENPTSDEVEKDEQPAADETAEVDDLSKLRANVQAAMDGLDNKVRKDLLVGKPGIGQMSVDELNQLLIDIRKVSE